MPTSVVPVLPEVSNQKDSMSSFVSSSYDSLEESKEQAKTPTGFFAMGSADLEGEETKEQPITETQVLRDQIADY